MFLNRWFTNHTAYFLIFCLLILWPALSVLANSQVERVPQAVSLTIQPATQTVKNIGDTFTIEIAASGLENLGSFEFSIDYDPALIQFQQASLNESFLNGTGRSFSAVGPDNNSDTGTVAYGAFSLGNTPDGPNGNGTLATLTFSALAQGSGTLNFIEAGVTNIAGNAQEISQMTGGQVTIGEKGGSTQSNLYLPVTIR